MTQTNQRQSSPASAALVPPQDFVMSPSYAIRPTADAISDNDTSEKPVREKLKKTSLASMSSHVKGRQERAFEADEENSTLHHVYRDSSAEKITDHKDLESRGRPVKKRSFDNLDAPDVESIETEKDQVEKPNANGHLRKRSRDVRTGEVPHEIRRPLLAGTSVREEEEDDANGSETGDDFVECSTSAMDSNRPPIKALSQVEIEPDKTLEGVNEIEQPSSGTVQEYQVTGTGEDLADQEMRDSASSPQKKRSRDQFDTEADREQKIPATEEARAHRRSDELERVDNCATRSRSPISLKGPMALDQHVTVEEREDKGMMSHAGAERQEVGFTAPSANSSSMPKSIQRSLRNPFGSVSTLPSASLHRSESSNRESTSAIKTTDHGSQRSADAFASSGFAALAASSTSPFGTLGGSSTSGIDSPLISTRTFNLENAKAEKKVAQKSQIAVNSALDTLANKTPTSSSRTGQSPFGLSGVNKTSGFGNSVFGSAFSGPFSGGNRLTSFAAPTGSVKLGISKSLGSPTCEEGDVENSDHEGGELAEKNKGEEENEGDGRFQHQDGRHNFSQRKKKF